MALQYDYRELSGTVTVKYGDNEHTFRFFEGNALMIVLNEYTDDDGVERCNLAWFLCDEHHAKACLGLGKDKTNMFDPATITHMTIYREHCRQWKTIADLFTKAFPDIVIELRNAQNAQ